MVYGNRCCWSFLQRWKGIVEGVWYTQNPKKYVQAISEVRNKPIRNLKEVIQPHAERVAKLRRKYENPANANASGDADANAGTGDAKPRRKCDIRTNAGDADAKLRRTYESPANADATDAWVANITKGEHSIRIRLCGIPKRRLWTVHKLGAAILRASKAEGRVSLSTQAPPSHQASQSTRGLIASSNDSLPKAEAPRLVPRDSARADLIEFAELFLTPGNYYAPGGRAVPVKKSKYFEAVSLIEHTQLFEKRFYGELARFPGKIQFIQVLWAYEKFSTLKTAMPKPCEL